MLKKAIFPGTFDPFTNGHLDIVNKGLKLFDKIVVAIGVNARKEQMFSLEQRLEWIRAVFVDNAQIEVAHYTGLTTKFCRQVGAQFILRGLRTSADFEYEKQIAFVNENLNDEVQSVFIMSEQQNSIVSSTIIRDLIRHGGAYKKFLPEAINIQHWIDNNSME